ncbi:MAG: tetrahydromethanopterin S-methyltransferase subunit B [Mariniflexile sp.]|jgi:hypothetical protein
MNFLKPLTLLFFLFALSSFSQNTESEDNKLSLNSGTLDNQFDYVIKKSGKFIDERRQEYRVVKSFWLTDLKSHVHDSIKGIQKNLVNSQITLKAQAQEISDLKTSLDSTQSTLDKTKNEKDNMSMLGTQMSKDGYRTIMWSIIGTLFALLLFFIYKFKNSNTITKDAKRVLSDLEDEFEEHRKIAVEREQKVRRQLQDEINKQKVSKGKKP